MSSLNGIGVGIPYATYEGTGSITDSSTFYAPLETSLILQRGTGAPTWSRATKAWGFNELGYLEELASGCAFFGGARLVRNTVRTKSEDFSNAAWTKNSVTVTGTNVVVCANSTATQSIAQTGSLQQVFVGQYFRYCARVKRTTGGVEFLQILGASGGFGTGQYANFSLVTGTVNAVGCNASMELVVGTSDTYDISVRLLATTSALADGIILAIVDNISAARNASFAGDGVKSFQLLRAWSVDVTNYDASYVPEYVSVGVASFPYFGAGIDGAKYFNTGWNGSPLTCLGFRREMAATNNLLYCRDLSNAAWSTKTNITAAKAATGIDGVANTATTLTATASDAIILQPITLASAARCASAYVKRRTGTGTISFTQDGGSTWTDITSQINSSTYSRVQITSTLANPSVGFKISTNGDAIDVDVVQNEAGSVATSPIITTTATVTRNADSLTYPTTGNVDFATGTLYGEAQFAAAAIVRRLAVVGSDGYSYSNNVDPYTVWKAYDGTNIIQQTGLSDITTATRKRVVAWGSGTMRATGDGIAPASGSFDGSFGGISAIEIGPSSIGYIRNLAIYNYKMTDAQLQAITL